MLTKENTRSRSDQGTTRSRKGGTRTLVSYVPVATALVGVTLVITSVVFFYVEDDLRRLMSVTLGLGILMIGIWFAANPFIKNARRFMPLRREVDGFIDLVRLLNTQVLGEAAPENVARTTAEMHESVERMVEEAAKTS